MRKRRNYRNKKTTRDIRSHIVLLFSFATIVSVFIFFVSGFITVQKGSVLGIEGKRLAMLPINDGGDVITRPSPTPTVSLKVTTIPLIYKAPTVTLTQNQLLNSPASNSHTGLDSHSTSNGFFIIVTPTPAPVGNDQNITDYINEQFPTPPPPPTPTPITYCTVIDNTGTTVIINDGQQCPGTNYLCQNASCTGYCTSNPSGCFGGAGACQSGGTCAPAAQSTFTPLNQTSYPSPTPNPIQNSQVTPTQNNSTNNFAPLPQNTQNGTSGYQQRQGSGGPQTFFQSFFQIIPFFKSQTVSPTETPQQQEPLFRGTATLLNENGVISHEIKVQITIKDGKLVVIATRADGASVTLSDESTQRLIDLMALGNFPSLQKYSGNSFIVKKGGTDAVTKLPTSINLPFGTITVTTPNGDQQLGLTPDQAVDAAMTNDTLTNVDTKQSFWDYIFRGPSKGQPDRIIAITTLPSGDAVFAVTGTVKKRFVASFPIDIKRTVYVSPDTGRIVKVTEDPVAKFLDNISVDYTPVQYQ